MKSKLELELELNLKKIPTVRYISESMFNMPYYKNLFTRNSTIYLPLYFADDYREIEDDDADSFYDAVQIRVRFRLRMTIHDLFSAHRSENIDMYMAIHLKDIRSYFARFELIAAV